MNRRAVAATLVALCLFPAVTRAADEPPVPGSPDPSAPSPSAPSTPAPSSVQKVAPETVEAILGRRVTDPEGKDIGRLVDVLVDDNGQPQAAVIDFGGFMGVGNRKIAVHWSTLHFNPADGKHLIVLDMTPDQVKAAPEYLSPDKPASVVTPADVTPTQH